MHRWRVREHGEPGPAESVKNRRRKERQPCEIEGCERPRKGARWCHLHTERIRRTGEAGTVQPLLVRGRVKARSDGYVRLTLPGGRRVLEHVYVKEQELGRHLIDGENVHHRNGIRSDNRPENLELWLTMQPTGQRVEDLMKYIAEHHAEPMRRLLDGGQ